MVCNQRAHLLPDGLISQSPQCHDSENPAAKRPRVQEIFGNAISADRLSHTNQMSGCRFCRRPVILVPEVKKDDVIAMCEWRQRLVGGAEALFQQRLPEVCHAPSSQVFRLPIHSERKNACQEE